MRHFSKKVKPIGDSKKSILDVFKTIDFFFSRRRKDAETQSSVERIPDFVYGFHSFASWRLCVFARENEVLEQVYFARIFFLFFRLLFARVSVKVSVFVFSK